MTRPAKQHSKTTATRLRPNFLGGIESYPRLKEECLVSRAVCVHIRVEPSLGVSDMQNSALHDAGFELMTVAMNQQDLYILSDNR